MSTVLRVIASFKIDKRGVSSGGISPHLTSKPTVRHRPVAARLYAGVDEFLRPASFMPCGTFRATCNETPTPGGSRSGAVVGWTFAVPVRR